ncbi:microtubule-associated protein futsch-like isoform X1 [Acipenser ruthenus]|uniref:microtubule-associated protein futsch-like isoform X1 n=1 Tax=Acipenser ruthenus TaxID=7906 RepID=UPI00274201C2|nr:microtubule-associated protein futsch-like isoform X1 [Acipenser ruthenus]
MESWQPGGSGGAQYPGRVQQELRHSEQRRMELQKMLKTLHRDQRLMRVSELQAQWHEVSERERRARLRNQQLLRDFQRVEEAMGELSEHNAAMSRIRTEYERQLEKRFPRWQKKLEEKWRAAQQSKQQAEWSSEPYVLKPALHNFVPGGESWREGVPNPRAGAPQHSNTGLAGRSYIQSPSNHQVPWLGDFLAKTNPFQNYGVAPSADPLAQGGPGREAINDPRRRFQSLQEPASYLCQQNAFQWDSPLDSPHVGQTNPKIPFPSGLGGRLGRQSRVEAERAARPRASPSSGDSAAERGSRRSSRATKPAVLQETLPRAKRWERMASEPHELDVKPVRLLSAGVDLSENSSVSGDTGSEQSWRVRERKKERRNAGKGRTSREESISEESISEASQQPPEEYGQLASSNGNSRSEKRVSERGLEEWDKEGRPVNITTAFPGTQTGTPSRSESEESEKLGRRDSQEQGEISLEKEVALVNGRIVSMGREEKRGEGIREEGDSLGTDEEGEAVYSGEEQLDPVEPSRESCLGNIKDGGVGEDLGSPVAMAVVDSAKANTEEEPEIGCKDSEATREVEEMEMGKESEMFGEEPSGDESEGSGKEEGGRQGGEGQQEGGGEGEEEGSEEEEEPEESEEGEEEAGDEEESEEEKEEVPEEERSGEGCDGTDSEDEIVTSRNRTMPSESLGEQIDAEVQLDRTGGAALAVSDEGGGGTESSDEEGERGGSEAVESEGEEEGDEIEALLAPREDNTDERFPGVSRADEESTRRGDGRIGEEKETPAQCSPAQTQLEEHMEGGEHQRVKNEKTFLVKPKELWRNSEDSDLGTDPSPRPPHTERAGGGDEFDDFYD